MPWYSLSPSCQKGIISGIHWMQNGPAFTIGPFAELNFETASDVSLFRIIEIGSNNFLFS